MGKGGPSEEGEESLRIAADPTSYPSRMKDKIKAVSVSITLLNPLSMVSGVSKRSTGFTDGAVLCLLGPVEFSQVHRMISVIHVRSGSEACSSFKT